jgi:hypothetical protein
VYCQSLITPSDGHFGRWLHGHDIAFGCEKASVKLVPFRGFAEPFKTARIRSSNTGSLSGLQTQIEKRFSSQVGAPLTAGSGSANRYGGSGDYLPEPFNARRLVLIIGAHAGKF